MATSDGLQAGDLDPTFGDAGQVITDFSSVVPGPTNDRINGTVIQPWDQKIIAVGTAYNPATREREGVIARYNPDGSLDQDFGTGGLVASGIGPDFFGSGFGGSDQFFDVALQPADRKIVVAGVLGTGTILVCRFHSNGVLDTSFGDFGGFGLKGSGLGAGARSVAIQPDGGILVGGYRYKQEVYPNKEYAIGRLNSNGQFYDSFGADISNSSWSFDDGLLVRNGGGTPEEITSLAVDPNDEGGGFVATGPGGNFGYSLSHFDGDGGAKADTYFFDPLNWIVSKAVTWHPDGGNVSAGYLQRSTGSGVEYDVVTVRQDADFQIADTYIGVGAQYPNVVGVAVQQDRKIVVAAEYMSLRLNADSSLDTGFGDNGFIHFDSTSTRFSDMEIQQDGNILMAGYRHWNSVSGEDFLITRYLAEDEVAQTPPQADAGGPYTTLADGSVPLDASGSSDDQQPTETLAFSWDLDGDQIFGETGADASNGNETGIAPIFSAPQFAAGTQVPIELRVTDDFGDRATASTTVTIGEKIEDTSLWKLDDEFGVNGTTATDFGFTHDTASAVAVQGDGKLVVAGASDGDLALVRYQTNGELDPTFGNGGKVTTDISGFHDGVSSIAIQSDGKIAVAGSARGNDFIVARYNEDGTLDDGSVNDSTPGDTFGSTGWAVANFGVSAEAYDLKQQADGKLVAVGEANVGVGNTAFGIARFHVDGTPDETFGQQGVVTADLTPIGDRARAVVRQEDGKLVVIGYASPRDFGIVRLNVDGSLDDGTANDSTPNDAFGTAGIVVSDFGGGSLEQANDAAVLPDGRILVAGRSDNALAVARYLPDGSLDSTFGQNGRVLRLDSPRAEGLDVRSDGSFVVAGDLRPSTTDFAIARFKANGDLDEFFPGNAILTVDLSGRNDFGMDVVIQADGRVVMVGTAANSDTSRDMAVARFVGNKQPTANAGGPYSVAADGTVQLDASLSNDPDQDNTTLNFVWDLDGDNVFGETDADATHGNEIGIAPTFSAIGLFGGQTVDVTLQVTDAQGATATATSTIAVEQPGPGDVANVVENLVDAGETEVEFAIDPTNADDFFAAVGSLPPSTSGNVDVSLTLDDSIYSGKAVSVPQGYRLVIDGKEARPEIQGASPALEIFSGQVVVQNGVRLTNATDAPTIRVHDGSLTLQNVDIEESTVADQAAIEVLGGTVDLGSSAELGGNTIIVRGLGDAIRNLSGGDITALGNTFRIDEAAIADPFLIEELIHHKLDDEPLGLVSYLDENVAPRVAIDEISTLVVPVGAPVSLLGSFVDVGAPQEHVAHWTLSVQALADLIVVPGVVDESLGAGTVEASYTFEEPNIYQVELTVSDGQDESTAQSLNAVDAIVVVYDPSAGFVTGGGWIESPAGAYAADPSLTDRASFGFQAKYKKGATTPTGETQFSFRMADLNFDSESYDWLVVAGSRAKFKGRGTINGAGDYGFMITAIDGDSGPGDGVDRFRIKIWDHVSGDVVYDNMVGANENLQDGTILSGGQIMIHDNKTNSSDAH